MSQRTPLTRPPGVSRDDWDLALHFWRLGVGISPEDALRKCQEPGGPLEPRSADDQADITEDPAWLAEVIEEDWDMALEIQADRRNRGLS